MRTMAAGIAGMLWICGLAASAAAQSAPTCAYDGATATVTVTADGQVARVQAIASSGEIRLNGIACGGATVTNTDFILIAGGGLDDDVRLSGKFVPGLTAESDGASEIEMSIALGAGSDTVTVNLSNGADKIRFGSGGIDVGSDLDEDITLAGTEFVDVDAMGGNDFVNAADYTGTPAGGELDLYGGDGDDRLTGDARRNQIFGGPGADELYGKGGNDDLYGGPGNDGMYGSADHDQFIADATLDGDDYMNGGSGINTANYSARTTSVTVTLGDGLANDGGAGEFDFIESNINRVTGGSAGDVLVAASIGSALLGRGGDDELHGGPGQDGMYAGSGNDSLIGGDGDDFVFGEAGDDVLDGGPGLDYFEAGDGNDILFNADGRRETVNCGAGTDDAEPDPLDTFIGCEL